MSPASARLSIVPTFLTLALTLFAAPPPLASAQEIPLIPRAILFGNPDRMNVQLSPDGRRISFLAPLDNVPNVWVAPVGDPAAARPVTRATRGIRTHVWAHTSDHVVYLQDKDGDENYNAFCVDLATRRARNLTPNPAVAARIEAISPHFPDQILVGVNDRDPRFHDVYRFDLKTGRRTLVAEHPGTIGDQTVSGFHIDDQFRVRFATASTPDGGLQLYRRSDATPDGPKFQWEPADRIGMEDAMNTRPRAWDKAGDTLYLTDSRGRDTGALFAWDLKTGQKKLLAEDPRADVGGLLLHPTEKNVQAVSIDYDRRIWKVLDPAIQPDFDYLKTVADGDFLVSSRSLDDSRWIVTYLMDDGPARYYLYDRADGQRKATFLFSALKALEGLPLQKMHPLVIKSGDGLDLVSYLTLPAGATISGQVHDAHGKPVPKPAQPLPTVLLVHGGPWGRDGWGYNATHQWLANRGYAVLSVNFRASTGFGKAFLNAGNRQWGAKMHDDLLDGVNFLVEHRIARPDKIAIMGTSYGGYATLAALTFSPDTFACGVDIVGPANLVTLLQTVPPYWTAGLANLRARVGDESSDEGRQFLASRSPLTHAHRIKKPLLIGQGRNDPRVRQAESDQIVNAMREKNLPVTYVLYPDEGHGFTRAPNRMSFNAVAELFLAEHLSGRAQPVGDDFKGSSLTVPTGAEHIKGLREALAEPQTTPSRRRPQRTPLRRP